MIDNSIWLKNIINYIYIMKIFLKRRAKILNIIENILKLCSIEKK